MKTVKKSFATAALIAAAGSAHAASLEVDFQATIASEQHPTYAGEARYYHVSVNPNNAGIGSYAATIVGTNNPADPFVRYFDQEVVAYKWIGGTNNDINGVSVSGGDAGRITYATQDTTFDGFGQQQLKFWDATDPGPDIATGGIDPYSVSHDGGSTGGYRSFGGATGTIDISGYLAGSLYVFYGAFNTTPTVSVVLKDSNGIAPDITIANAHLNGDGANRTEYYVAEIDFVTDGVYDTIEYEHLANGVDYSGNGRGLGTLLTGSTTPPPELTLEVNTVTGVMKLLGDDNGTMSMNYYQITSAGDSLSTAGWNSLADQDFEGNGPANGTGNGWEEAGGSSASVLAEAYLLGESEIAVDQEINLGQAYNTSIDAQDLVFTFLNSLGKQFDGTVVYVQSAIPGDTDGDGDVDDADLGTSFSNYTGPGGSGKTAAQGDTDGDGDVDDGDLGVSFSNYTGPLGPSVPEPASLVLLGLGALVAGRRRR